MDINGVRPPQNSPVSPLLIPRVLWAAMIFSTFMYALILMIRVGEGGLPDEQFLQTLEIISLGLLIASFTIPDLVFRSALSGYSGEITFPKAAQLYLVPLVLRLALSEAICIFGLILGMQSSVKFFYPFWAVGLISMLLAFPSERGIMKRVEKAKA